jgi:predicted LPLAT superfamily acyltransferase
MFSVFIIATLITLSVAFAVLVPCIAVHFELVRKHERRHEEELLRQLEIIVDQDATIDAYRQFAQQDPELAWSIR